jgi:hypothetical protein
MVSSEFNNLLQSLYSLSLEDRIELKNLLEHNITDSRRDEIARNYKNSQMEQKSGKLKFTSNISELKKML